MGKSKKTKLSLGATVSKAMVVAVITVSFLVGANAAYAASWVVSSSVACPPGLNPSGASYLSWSGYWPWDYGTTTGGLWYWQNGSWVLQNNATTIGASGSSGSAYAYTGAARQPGYWTQTGGHTATFFSGSQNSYAPIISC